jgi:putative ABC transport system permease protein
MKTFIRNFRKQKTTGWLSIVSLGLGTMTAIIIGVWSINEYSFDRFQKDGDRMYRITEQAYINNTLTKIPSDESGLSYDEQYLANVADVEEFVYFLNMDYGRLSVKTGDTEHAAVPAILARENFFTFFTFPLREGDPQTALDIPGKVVIDETTAARMFPEGDALGQVMKINGNDYEVSGVMYDMPRNSHLQTRMVIPQKNHRLGRSFTTFHSIYYRLARGADAAALEQALTAEARERKSYLKDLDFELRLQPLRDIHFGGENEYMLETAVTGSKMVARVYISVAAVILLLACINFTNLFVSGSFLRAKATGVRQVIGARWSAIRRSFYAETACYAAVSLAAGLCLAVALVPYFNRFTGSAMFIDFASAELYLFLAALFAAVVLAAGTMPAFRIARMRPLETIKGTYRGRPMPVFQKGLTIVQFTASIALLLVTLLISNQVDFMLGQSIGFNRENIVYAHANIRDEQYETLRSELMKAPGVLDVTLKNCLPTEWQTAQVVKNVGSDKGQSFECLYIKPNYFDVMGMQLLEGENPIGKYEGSRVCVLNETAARLLGFDNPIDQTFIATGEPFVVKGVVRDAQVRSFHKSADPQIYVSTSYLGWKGAGYVPVLVKITGNPQQALAAIERQWNVALPDAPFEYHFLDEEYEKMYTAECNLRNTLSCAMLIGFAISVAGLFAMAFHSTQRRRKEIAIRKVHGTSVMDLLRLLNKSFMLWILVAFLLGSAGAWCFMEKFWLKSFIAHAPLSAGIFAGVGMVACAVALLTVSWQTWSAATANPVKSIKAE